MCRLLVLTVGALGQPADEDAARVDDLLLGSGSGSSSLARGRHRSLDLLAGNALGVRRLHRGRGAAGILKHNIAGPVGVWEQ